MCQPTLCRTCGKTTWAGCGMHVDDVRRSVPAAQWCGGHDEPRAGGGGFLSRLFGGR
ncbi:hypothetical protein ATJ88_0209 [Isoptericola jiangsuensis]|uniref:Uncharacterized protein n=1 Tax=Isoptericola jiangsuensis TaxID=548579 RepID=A0A2A9ER09_9MICO|nr:hypothetical protein [Isoptericola jiangsuensis]PFG41567.1 hypothetical protein ATJ88_0209 [Isoptericola jiangsuensis]